MDLIFFKIAIACIWAGPSVIWYSFWCRRQPSDIGILFRSRRIRCPLALDFSQGLFSGFFPLATPFDALSLFAWVVVGLFLVLQYKDPSPIFGCFAAPIAAVVLIFASTLSYQIRAPIVPVMRSWWLPIHVTLALAGDGVFALMAIGGMMYLLQERLIKRKRMGRIHRLLPSLETLDTINRPGPLLGFSADARHHFRRCGLVACGATTGAGTPRKPGA